jgi:ATP-dependent RNA helicase RhlE
MSFESLGLMPELLRAIAERGYDVPTPVQARAIPEILADRDILAGSQTGTGKTAGFTLPLLQKLAASSNSSQGNHRPRALVLVPTRELAMQVAESVRTYGKHLRLRTAVVFGGVSINAQIDALRRGTDIVVATPGRLLDHAQQRTIDLSQVEILVLDEADRMLDMGFINDIRRVLKLLPPVRQNLMFSATYSNDIRSLAERLLQDPVTIDIARRNMPVESVTQEAYSVGKEQKRALLSHLIRTGNWTQVLVFTRTKHGANRLSRQLEEDGIASAPIHGNKSQAARTKALADFKQGRIVALVATEVAARGLDINQLPHVVNFELPNVPEDYVHRIGRTGRAGATGTAVSLIASDEHGLLKAIERVIGRSVVRLPLPEISFVEPRKLPPLPGNSGDRNFGGAAQHSEHRRRPGGQSRPGTGSRGNSGSAGQRSGGGQKRAWGGAR